VGERAKIKYRVPETNAIRVVTGTVLSVEGGTLELRSEEKSEVVSMPLAEIKEAKIDFQF
jgi:ribosome maturation factor RimP